MTAAVATDVAGDALLVEAAQGDPQRLAALRARVRAGEPAAYVAGFMDFAGHRFRMDSRAYVTDPEASFLVASVIDEGTRWQVAAGRAPHLLEFGIGAGTLAISVKLARPDWTLSGIDIDAQALTLAADNARLHAVDIDLIESDYLAGWPAVAAAPDIIFGDPPWGDASDLYDSIRDEHYYHYMPAASVFPPGGQRSAIHDELIRRVVARGWRSLVILNYGILPPAVIEASAAPLAEWRLLHPRPDLSVLVGRGTA